MKRPPRTQQVSPGGQSMPAAQFHTLFAPIDGVSSPDYMPEPIAKIFVTRFESRGQVQALRPFRPEELQDNAGLFVRFGGGTYELVARREDGTIYAKRLITLEGEPKSMNGEPVQPANGAAPAAAGGVAVPTAPALPAPTNASETMLHYMMQMNMQQSAMMGNVLVAMLGGNKSDATEQARAMQETMRATIEMMKATIPPAAPPQSGVSVAKEIFEVAKMLQPPPPAAPVVAPPKEESTTDIIGALGGALANFMQMAAQTQGAPAALTQAVSQAMQG